MKVSGKTDWFGHKVGQAAESRAGSTDEVTIELSDEEGEETPRKEDQQINIKGGRAALVCPRPEQVKAGAGESPMAKA